MMNIHRASVVLFLIVLISGCASKLQRAIESVQEIIVSYPTSDNLVKGETWVGWIYLDYDGTNVADAVVYIRDDGKAASWEVSEESISGYFGESITSGKIGENGLLVGFPQLGLAKARNIWASGGVNAFVNGLAIPSR